jgi:hypothetical protein
MSDPNTKQEGGAHYGLKQYQHWDMVAEFNLDYFQGQITKYVMRWKKKGGLPDLRKAQHFIEKYIHLAEQGRLPDWHPAEEPTKHYVDQDK